MSVEGSELLVTISSECEYCHLVNGDHQMWCVNNRSDQIPGWVWLGIITPATVLVGWLIGQWIGRMVWT